ncbi:restriction endonuclease subunit S [Prevotella copri]|nr:restriction endonuclease subunit S [Segatella copri]MCW4124841.1 restriction endonuclease subunit S [Segatella copri]MCW4135856.1 restriction endonuclease subunit S [Segatella copri]
MEWKHYKMDELIEEISMGPFGSDVKKEFYVDNGVPILNGSNLQGFKLKEDSFGYLTKEKADSLKKCNAHRGDIIVTHRGTLGQIVYVPVNSKYDRYVISQSQFRFRCKADLVDVQYLVYYFHTREGQYKILANASQVGVPALARATSTFRLIDIKLPPLDDQRRIASILSSLDRKIELNNKINADLEEMAQAIFKNWFVDFEPFKDGKFVDSELGMIPEGWKVGSPYEYVKVVYGAPYKSAKFNDNGEGLPLIRIRDLKDCNPQFYTPEILPQTEYVNMGDIVAGMDAEFVPHIWKGNTGLLNQRVCKLMPQQTSISNLFVLYLMKPELEFVQSYKTGTTVSHLGKADIDKFVVVLPPLKVVEECSKILDSILQRIKNISAESRNLSTLRDTLLPRLMSGELEVPE